MQTSKRIILSFMLITVVLLCGCDFMNPQPEKPEPIICDKNWVTAENFHINLVWAFAGKPPEVADGKDATPFIVRLTYTGSEGASYMLGDASSETDQYLRFRIIYADKYRFEEYTIFDASSAFNKIYPVHTGDILKDLSFLHFEPMDEELELHLWMIIPEEVMQSDESTYFVINVGEQEFWFDITNDDLGWYKEHLK